MRIVDADILSYALFDESPAHRESWKFIEDSFRRHMELHVSMTSILETYNALFWFYRVRPRNLLLRKMTMILEGIAAVPTSPEGVGMSLRENIPLGDGFLVATAIENKLPVVVSNDNHIARVAPKLGLIVENPLSARTRKALSRSRKTD